MYHVESALVPEFVKEEVEHILAAVTGTVFYDAAGNALILGNDHTWIARVTYDTVKAYVEETYLSTLPIENYVSTVEDTYTVEMLPELTGFETGFTC